MDKRRQRTREAIEAAFVELIDEQGYVKTTVQDILEQPVASWCRDPALRSLLGRFSGGRMTADLDSRAVTLDRGARLHIVQARSRGPR